MRRKIAAVLFGWLAAAGWACGQAVDPSPGQAAGQELFAPTRPGADARGQKQWYLHLNGYTIHFDKRPEPGDTVNDYLIGLGTSVRFQTDSDWVWGIAGDLFLDSNEEISGVIGPTVEYFLHERVTIGAAGFLMYKESFDRDYGFPFLPVPLPFVDFDLKRVNLRCFYIPPVRRPTDHQISFQLRIPL